MREVFLALEAMRDTLYKVGNAEEVNFNQLDHAEKELKNFAESKESEAELFSELLSHYGPVEQMDQFVEEAGEVLQAQNKLRRTGVEIKKWGDNTEFNAKHAEALDNLTEELADLQLMLDQMKLLVNPEDLAYWRSQKVLRLRARLSESKINKSKEFRQAMSNNCGMDNLFITLVENGLTPSKDQLIQFMEAMKKDLTLTEQMEFMDMPENQVEEFVLKHDGKTFIPAENGIEVIDPINESERHGLE